MNGYTAKIVNSSFELSARDRIAFKDTSDAIALDEETATGPLVIEGVKGYVNIGIHNELAKGDNKDYGKIVVVGTDGNKYVTGSEAFISAFTDIYEEMLDDVSEDENGNRVLPAFGIKVYQKESKNYKGKHFLTCSIL